MVQNAGDVIVENGGQGNDTVQSSVTYTLTAGADVETLRTTDDNGTAAINLTGNAANNQVIGNNGDNTLNGGGGNSDQLTGRGGNDTYIVNSANVTITESGGQGIDTVLSSVTYHADRRRRRRDAGDQQRHRHRGDQPDRQRQRQRRRGNNGNNVLNGGDGRDDLIGRGGQDQFLFNTAPNAATNHDRIIDFNVADDTILLENAVFTAFAAGDLAADRIFVVGTGVQDANDNIVYDRSTGALFYDSDGVGGTAAIQFAEVTPGLVLTNLDFLVV